MKWMRWKIPKKRRRDDWMGMVRASQDLVLVKYEECEMIVWVKRV